jgi:NADH-quinone oxidoreductase subunit C
MTVALNAKEVATRLEQHFPRSIIEANGNSLLVKIESLYALADYLKKAPEFKFDYLDYIMSVDYYDYFELIYQFTSLEYNHRLILKTHCHGRENLTAPSLVGLYKTADFQEREINDLMGIKFEGHPNLKPIFLWEGFQSYPLRKDYLE